MVKFYKVAKVMKIFKKVKWSDDGDMHHPLFENKY
jgi:hypothetical protein